MVNLILTTDTLHHKFFIKSISNFSDVIVIYETKKIKFKYKVYHAYKIQEYKFEKKFFFKNKIPSISVKKFKDLNQKKAIDFIKKQKFNNIFCFGIGRLRPNFLKAFKDKKILNFHGGNPLYYRGLDSLIWSIYNKDFTNLCTCLHFVDEGLDTGNIVFKKKIIINNKTKLKELRSINTLNTIYLYKKFIQLKKVKFKKQNRIGKYYSAFPSSKINICIKNIKNYGKK